jgi:hypothetical protein
MKLTWFGGTAFRVHLGGKVVVVNAAAAPSNVDPAEIKSGADSEAEMRAGPITDPSAWRAKLAPRATEPANPIEILRIGPNALLIAAAGEAPLVILGPGELPRFGRWADGAVVVLTSARESLVAEATVLLDVARPRLIALAVEDQMLDLAIEELAEHLDGAGLSALEPGLALEV